MGIILEERIERISRTKELELDGEAYVGKYELNNFDSIDNFISKKLRLDERGKNIPYMNQNTGNEFILSGKSSGKLAKHWKDGEAYQKSLVHIPEIIEKMQFLDMMPADKERSKFKEYSYYIIPAKIDGETYTIFSTVGHAENCVYYDQNVFNGTPKEVFARAKRTTRTFPQSHPRVFWKSSNSKYNK
jgi:hypothetical protein